MNEMGHHPWMSSVARDVTVMFAIMQWKKQFFVLNSGRSADHAYCNMIISAYGLQAENHNLHILSTSSVSPLMAHFVMNTPP